MFKMKKTALKRVVFLFIYVEEDNNGNYFWDAQVREKARRTVSATNPSVGGLASKNSEDAVSITKKPNDVKRFNRMEGFICL